MFFLAIFRVVSAMVNDVLRLQHAKLVAGFLLAPNFELFEENLEKIMIFNFVKKNVDFGAKKQNFVQIFLQLSYPDM